jgi:ATP-dependent NAD(P)H-hydrate dehydratase
MTTRTASKRAFRKEKRGVVTEDMLPEVSKAFTEMFEDEDKIE